MGSNHQNVRLLSLDGGGVKGITSLLILKRLMRVMKDQGGLKSEPRPCEVFDIIGGTSTGGLIAILLGRLGLDVDSCISLYRKLAEKVFPRPAGIMRTAVQGMFSNSVYSIETLQKCIQDILEEQGHQREAAFNDNAEHGTRTYVYAIIFFSPLHSVFRILAIDVQNDLTCENLLWDILTFHKIRLRDKAGNSCLRTGPQLQEQSGRSDKLPMRDLGSWFCYSSSSDSFYASEIPAIWFTFW